MGLYASKQKKSRFSLSFQDRLLLSTPLEGKADLVFDVHDCVLCAVESTEGIS